MKFLWKIFDTSHIEPNPRVFTEHVITIAEIMMGFALYDCVYNTKLPLEPDRTVTFLSTIMMIPQAEISWAVTVCLVVLAVVMFLFLVENERVNWSPDGIVSLLAIGSAGIGVIVGTGHIAGYRGGCVMAIAEFLFLGRKFEAAMIAKRSIEKGPADNHE